MSDDMRIKICGINSEDAFDAAVEAGADWIGLNFFPPSPRAVSPQRAAELSGRSRRGPLRVGLFVDPSEAEISRVLDAVALDVLQLYVAADRAAALRARFGIPVWRPVGVRARPDLPVAAEAVDAFLIESKPPADASRPGGNGVVFDWALTQDWDAPLPWLLAGGLTPDNVRSAVIASGAPALDVSSGVEERPGVKSPRLIRQFISNARLAPRKLSC